MKFALIMMKIVKIKTQFIICEQLILTFMETANISMAFHQSKLNVVMQKIIDMICTFWTWNNNKSV